MKNDKKEKNYTLSQKSAALGKNVAVQNLLTVQCYYTASHRVPA